MFLTYVNELATILENYGVKIIFADDAKLYIQILNDVDVVQLLQLAVDALVQWVTMWQLTVSC